MGIEQEDLPNLFERCYGVQNADTKNISGFGIWFYLSTEIVKRRDGEIWAESESGKGYFFL